MHQPPIDPYLIEFLERKLTPIKFQSIDGAIEDTILDKEREKTILDPSGRTESAKLADSFRHHLAENKIEVEAKSLAADAIPGFIMLDENQRRMRDYMKSLDRNDAFSGSDLFKGTFVVNTNNKLVQAIQKLDQTNPELAKELVNHTYDLARLSQQEMDPSDLNGFVSRSNHVLEKLALMLQTEK